MEEEAAVEAAEEEAAVAAPPPPPPPVVRPRHWTCRRRASRVSIVWDVKKGTLYPRTKNATQPVTCLSAHEVAGWFGRTAVRPLLCCCL